MLQYARVPENATRGAPYPYVSNIPAVGASFPRSDVRTSGPRVATMRLIFSFFF